MSKYYKSSLRIYYSSKRYNCKQFRDLSPDDPRYEWCSEWETFEGFKSWYISQCAQFHLDLSDGLYQVRKKDASKGYTQENCYVSKDFKVGSHTRKYSMRTLDDNIYHLWTFVRQRCRKRLKKNPELSHIYYFYYQWEKDYNLFRDWCISNGYQPGKALLRKDKYKGYLPDNCYFEEAHKDTFSRERKFFIYHGDVKAISEWEKTGLFHKSEINYLKKATVNVKPNKDGYFDIEKILKGKKSNLLEYNGERHTVLEWAKILDYTPQAIYNWIKRGLTIEQALDTYSRFQHGKQKVN